MTRVVSRHVQDLWQGRHVGLLNRLCLVLLCIPAFLYGSAMHLRGWLYRIRLFKVLHLPRPVISVGNITVGGTGKTPVTAWIARYLMAQGLRVAVLSRGYGGTLEGKTAVVSDGRSILLDPDQCGDEPYLLASSISGLLVVIGSDRYQAGLLAMEQLDPDIFILDDGFQHLRLYRDCNILLMDCVHPLGNGRILPAGPLREPPVARRRADLLVFTRCNASEQTAPGQLQIPYCRASHRLASFRSLVDGAELQPETLRHGRVVACAGIARPDSFFSSLQAIGIQPVALLALPDHESYTAATQVQIQQLLLQAGADWLLTTEKDAVKLQQLPVAWLSRVITARLELAFDSEAPLKQAIERFFKIA